MVSRYEAQGPDGVWEEQWRLIPGRFPRSFVVKTDEGNDIYLVECASDNSSTTIRKTFVGISDAKPAKDRSLVAKIEKRRESYVISSPSKREPYVRHRVTHL